MLLTLKSERNKDKRDYKQSVYQYLNLTDSF